jgi:hypothetical protein
MKHLRFLAPALLIGVVAMPMTASVLTFTDNTFNLSDYSIITYQSGVANSPNIHVSQTLTGGDPGAALQINIAVPAGNSLSLEYLLNPAFTYDPGANSAVSSIDFSQDVYYNSPVGVGAEAVFSLISQGGNLYENRIDVSPVDRVWELANATLQASDYALITNPSTFTTDNTSHPSFSSGALEFGFAEAWSSSGFGAYGDVQDLDNLSITINTPAPEPDTWRLLVAGLALIGVSAVRSRLITNRGIAR